MCGQSEIVARCRSRLKGYSGIRQLIFQPRSSNRLCRILLLLLPFEVLGLLSEGLLGNAIFELRSM